MHQHNGGEGCVGENLYVHMYPLEELEQINTDYEVQQYISECFIFATNMGGDLYGMHQNGSYFLIDSCSMNMKDILFFGTNLMEFFKKLDVYMTF